MHVRMIKISPCTHIHSGPFIPYNVTVIASNALGNGTKTSVLNFTLEGGQFSIYKLMIVVREYLHRDTGINKKQWELLF